MTSALNDSSSNRVGRFLGGIAALIWDPQTEHYLLLRRSAERDFGAGRWECVTGRVDQGEGYEEALHREVQEEIGVRVQIEFLIGTTHFYRGEPRPENELLGAIYGCTILDNQAPELRSEHSEFYWASLDEIHEKFPDDFWLYKVILKAERLRRLLPTELREEFRQTGFEI